MTAKLPGGSGREGRAWPPDERGPTAHDPKGEDNGQPTRLADSPGGGRGWSGRVEQVEAAAGNVGLVEADCLRPAPPTPMAIGWFYFYPVRLRQFGAALPSVVRWRDRPWLRVGVIKMGSADD